MRDGSAQRTGGTRRNQRRRQGLRGFAALTAATLLGGAGLVWGAQTSQAVTATGYVTPGEGINLGTYNRVSDGSITYTSSSGATRTEAAEGAYRYLTILSNNDAVGYCLEQQVGATLGGSIVHHELQWPSHYAAQLNANTTNVTPGYVANQGKIQWIIENGANPAEFSTFFPGQPRDYVMLGVQLAIWHYTDGGTYLQTSGTTREVYDALIAGAEANAASSTPVTPAAPATMNLAPSSATGTTGSIIGPLKLSMQHATNVKATLNTPVAGVSLVDKTGNPLPATLKDGSEIYLRAASGTAAGSVNVTVTGTTSSIMPGMIAQGYSGHQSRIIIPTNPSTSTFTTTGQFSWTTPAPATPWIGTFATLKGSTSKQIPAVGGTVTDKVEHKNLKPNTTYRLTGQLMDPGTGTAVGAAVSKDFTPTTSDGFVDVDLPVAKSTGARSLVAYETLYEVNGTVTTEVASHKVLNDAGQTVTQGAPITLSTTAQESVTGAKSLRVDQKIVDVVEYTGLTPGSTYTLTGQLMDKLLNAPVGAAASVPVTPTTANGTARLTFDVPATSVGRDLVVFEKLTLNGVVVGAHEEITSASQTVSILKPSIGTVATNKTDGSKTIPAAGGTVRDTVSYTNLTPGVTYQLTGQLMDKATQKPVGDAVTTQFTPTKATDSVNIDLPVQAATVGRNLVAFETVNIMNGTTVGAEVAVHKDFDSTSQTVSQGAPIRLATTATTGDGVTKTVTIGGKDTAIWLQDKVEYWNLTGGQQYTMNGELMEKITDSTGKSTGKSTGLTNSTPFTADSSGHGFVVLAFEVPVDIAAGKSLVAYESLTQKVNGVDVEVGSHKDINDAGQTVTFGEKPKPLEPPKPLDPPATKASVTTTARDAADDDKSVAPGGTVIDEVKYVGLVPGTTYTLTGQLMDKATKTPVGASVTSTFTPARADGTTELALPVPAGAKGKTLVVFETVTLNGKDVAVHHDIDSAPQTVTVPAIGTTATGSDGISKNIVIGAKGATATVLDLVKYTGLAGGQKYTVSGVLMDKANGAATGSIGSQEFTADATGNGTVTVTFSVPSSLIGRTLVAFETVTQNIKGKDVIVAEHRDLDDAAQTVTISAMPAPAKQNPPGADVGTGTGWNNQDAGTSTGWNNQNSDTGIKLLPQLPALPMTGVGALTWQLALAGLALALLGGTLMTATRKRRRQ